MSIPIIVPLQPEAEKGALSDLIQSEGWGIFERAMRERVSSARYEADVRQALDEAAPDTDVADVLRQINASYATLRQMVDWPKGRILELEHAKTRTLAETARDRFKRVLASEAVK